MRGRPERLLLYVCIVIQLSNESTAQKSESSWIFFYGQIKKNGKNEVQWLLLSFVKQKWGELKKLTSGSLFYRCVFVYLLFSFHSPLIHSYAGIHHCMAMCLFTSQTFVFGHTPIYRFSVFTLDVGCVCFVAVGDTIKISSSPLQQHEIREKQNMNTQNYIGNPYFDAIGPLDDDQWTYAHTYVSQKRAFSHWLFEPL